MDDYDTDEPWVCIKPGCTLGVDEHDLATVIEHTYGISEQDARDVSSRTLSKLADAFGIEPGGDA